MFSPPGRNHIRLDLRSRWCIRKARSAAPPNIWKPEIPRLGLKAMQRGSASLVLIGAHLKGSQIPLGHEFIFLMISAPQGPCTAASHLTLLQSPSRRYKVTSPIRTKHPCAAAGLLPIVALPWGRKGESEQMKSLFLINIFQSSPAESSQAERAGSAHGIVLPFVAFNHQPRSWHPIANSPGWSWLHDSLFKLLKCYHNKWLSFTLCVC